MIPGVCADGTPFTPDKLETVVIHGIVARGDHDAAIDTIERGREIHHLGAAETDVDDIDAGIVQSARNRPGKFGARLPDVPSHDDSAVGRHLGGIGAPYIISHINIEIVGDSPPYIISLESRKFFCTHICPPL